MTVNEGEKLKPANQIKSNSFSLKLSLASSFVGVAIITSAFIGFANYYHARDYARSNIREKMKNVVAIAALTINAQDHDQLLKPEDESSETYKKLKSTLQSIKLNFEDLRFIYTFRQQGNGNIEFVVDAETDPKLISHLGDPYNEVTESLNAAFQPPYIPQVEKGFASDQWGTWLSAFAPILRPDGSLAGVVGLDVSAEKILSYERKFLIAIFFISVISVSIVAFIGYIFANRLSRPLEALSTEMTKIQKLDLSSDTRIKSIIAEVANMGVAFDNMKKGLRSFGRYVPGEIVKDLIAMEKEASVGVENKDITVFFSDIADFTTISEKIGAKNVSDIMGDYLETVTKTIMSNQGAVDKYIGDAVMAFWGAPNPLENHAIIACKAALAVQKELEAFIKQCETRGLPTMLTRIGLNTGDAMVGNIGYSERLSYTAIGDTVNLASRLEGLNKFYDTKILLSHATYALAKDHIEARLIDKVIVKGKTIAIPIYELMALKGQLSSQKFEFAERFSEAMQLYLQRQWAMAQSTLETLLQIDPFDGPTKVILARCKQFAVQPPKDDWAGEIVLREK
ncbi:MAG: hypothetical protein NT027_11220 [Proteobacteria bacterium]|nr:hypothetical protein [Pseudomonadota bacterium]